MIGRQALLLGVGLTAVLVAGSWWWLAEDAVVLDADDTALVAQGAALYPQHCAECHGQNLEGQPNWQERKPDGTLPAPPHDASGHTWHHPDAYLFFYTKLGGAALAPPEFKSAMPPFEGVLSDRQIAAVLGYIKSRWPGPIRARQERLNQAR